MSQRYSMCETSGLFVKPITHQLEVSSAQTICTLSRNNAPL